MTDQPAGPTVFNDRYELHRKLAQGGMANVYLARDLLLDRPVAVKVLFPEHARDDAFVERFRREATAAANLNHPNVVAIYDWGQQHGTYYIVMEYVEGRPLSDIIRTEGPLHPDRAAEITADVASALAFAHRNGVVHRDVKPGNILITGTGQVKVADFGIAQASSNADATQNLTQAGAVMGTATYFSPEQAQGLPVDPRSDLYSLGCVLYEMLTARPPFAGDSPVAIAYKHVQEQPFPPSTINPTVPAALEAVDMKLLQKDPADRYASADDLRADLRRFLENQPVLALGAAGAAATVAGVGAGLAALGDATVAVPAAAPPTGAAPPYVEEPGRKRTGLYVGLLVVLLLLVAGILFFVGRNLGSTTKQVAVPSVTGQSAADATSQLESAGFKVNATTRQNDSIKEGEVFDQDPKGGVKADEGALVTIVVSSGAGKVDVPSVVGKTQAQATSLLTNAGFVPQVVQQPDDTIKAGEVISQSPAGGQADKGSTVIITVSSGVAQVSVPSVAGDDLAGASAALGAAGFKVTSIQQSSTSVASGTVIGTNPAAGTQMAKGSTVQVIVSSGPPATTTTTTAPTTTTTKATTTTTAAP
jgi:eukaryotic-like serine/threonine-protein kinase